MNKTISDFLPVFDRTKASVRAYHVRHCVELLCSNPNAKDYELEEYLYNTGHYDDNAESKIMSIIESARLQYDRAAAKFQKELDKENGVKSAKLPKLVYVRSSHKGRNHIYAAPLAIMLSQIFGYSLDPEYEDKVKSVTSLVNYLNKSAYNRCRYFDSYSVSNKEEFDAAADSSKSLYNEAV